MLRRFIRGALALAVAVAVAAAPVAVMAREPGAQGTVRDSLTDPSFRAGRNGQVYYRGNAGIAASVVTGAANLDWQALYEAQLRVNRGAETWRLDPLQAARVEGPQFGLSGTDRYTLFKQVRVGQYSGTGEAGVLAEHQGRAYVLELIQPFGPGSGMIWTINSVREITSAWEANAVARAAGLSFQYRGPNGPAVAAPNPIQTVARPNLPARRGRVVYYVQPGDTLWAVSVRYGVTVYRLIGLNPGLDANALWIGQTIIVDNGGTTSTPANETGGSGGAAVASGNGTIHVVEPGDTLWQIALRYSASVKAIMEANGITDANTLWVGRSIVIP